MNNSLPFDICADNIAQKDSESPENEITRKKKLITIAVSPEFYSNSLAKRSHFPVVDMQDYISQLQHTWKFDRKPGTTYSFIV